MVSIHHQVRFHVVVLKPIFRAEVVGDVDHRGVVFKTSAVTILIKGWHAVSAGLQEDVDDGHFLGREFDLTVRAAQGERTELPPYSICSL